MEDTDKFPLNLAVDPVPLLVKLALIWILFQPSWLWIIAFAAAFSFQTLVWRLLRKVLADYAHLHYEASSLSTTSFHSIQLEFKNFVTWAIWFDIPGEGIKVPLSKIYKPLPQHRSKDTRLQHRLPLERWDERYRLQIYCIGHITVELDFKAPKLINVTVRDIRMYNPQEKPATTAAEQKILFPDGYPNFIEPSYAIYRKLQRLIIPLYQYLTRNLVVNVHHAEIHKIPNPGFYRQKRPATPSIVDPIRNAVRRTTQSIMKPQGQVRKTADAEDLTVIIEHIQASFKDSQSLDFVLENLSIYEGKNYVLNSKTEVAIASLPQAQIHVVIDSFQESSSTDALKPKNLVLIADEKVLVGRSISLKLNLAIEPPYQINSEFVHDVIEAYNAGLAEKYKDGIESSAILSTFSSVIGLCWEDTGLAFATRSLASSIIVGVARNGAPITWNDDIQLGW